MRLGIDTNVLLMAHLPTLDAHERVSAYHTRVLSDSGTSVCIPPYVLNEFMFIVTSRKRFEHALSIKKAVRIARAYADAGNVEIIPECQESISLALEMMKTHGLGRRRIGDTMIAASLIAAGIQHLVTTNPRDFRIFSQFTLLDPLA